MLGRHSTDLGDRPANSFRDRAVATMTLRRLWEQAEKGTIVVLLTQLPGADPELQRKSVEHAVTTLADDMVEPFFGVWPWLGDCCVALGPPGSDAVVSELTACWAAALGVPADVVRADWAEVTDGVSLSDTVELAGTQPVRTVAVATSASHEFLVGLVARNRAESRESVLREAVSLLLDAGEDARLALAGDGR